MSNDKNINIGLGIDSDKSSFRDATNDVKKAGKEVEDFKKRVSAPIPMPILPFDNVDTSIQKADKSAKKFKNTLAEIPTELQRVQDGFDKVNKDVALAGDFESNLRTAGGALGAAGGAGAEKAIGIGAELPALIEALPRMKESMKGLPATLIASSSALTGVDLSAKAASLGLTGTAGTLAAVSLAALPFIAIGAAVASLVVAFKEFGKRSESARERAEEFTAGLEAVENAAKMTTNEIHELQAAEAEELEVIARKKAIIEERIEIEKEAQNGAQAFGESLGGMFDSAAVDEYQDVLGEYDDRIDEISINQEAYNQVLEEGSNSAANAAEAAEQAADALDDLNDTLMETASTEADLLRAELDAQDATKEANQDRLDQLAKEEKVLRRELEILKASGQACVATSLSRSQGNCAP